MQKGGGNFSQGRFSYYVGRGVTIKDVLEIQGIELEAKPVTDKIKVNIKEKIEEQ